jgi:hypothetical protein
MQDAMKCLALLAKNWMPVWFKTLGSQLLLTGNHQVQDEKNQLYLCFRFAIGDTSGLSSTDLQRTSRHGQQEARATYSTASKP